MISHSAKHKKMALFMTFTVGLVGSNTSHEGRLVVYRNYTWGTVCDNGFTDAAAKVVCFYLGSGYV